MYKALMVPALLAVAAGCTSDEKRQKLKQSVEFYDAMAAISRDVHEGSAKLREITTQATAAVEKGETFDRAAAEQLCEERVAKIRELRARAADLKPPPGPAGEALQQAMTRGLEGEERRVGVDLREWLALYADPELAIAKKRERGRVITERMDVDRKGDEEAIRAARQAFAKEFGILK